LHLLAITDGLCQRRRPELLAARVQKHKFNHRVFCVVFVVLQHQASWCEGSSGEYHSCEPELPKLPIHCCNFTAGFAFSSPVFD
jgi:hypothetical protein